jgi:hypothetical protein
MKHFLTWSLFLVMNWGVPVWAAEDASDFQPLQECLTNLKVARQETQRRMPAFFLNLDFNLRLMEEGITHLEGNYELLKKLVEDKRTEGSARHLVWNSAKACEDYLKSYERRTSMLFLLFLCVCLLVFLLPVSLVVQFFIRRNRARHAINVPEEQQSSSPPQDKVG